MEGWWWFWQRYGPHHYFGNRIWFLFFSDMKRALREGVEYEGKGGIDLLHDMQCIYDKFIHYIIRRSSFWSLRSSRLTSLELLFQLSKSGMSAEGSKGQASNSAARGGEMSNKREKQSTTRQQNMAAVKGMNPPSIIPSLYPPLFMYLLYRSVRCLENITRS